MLCQEQGMHILRGVSIGKITIRIFGDSYYSECHKSNKSQAGIIREKKRMQNTNYWKTSRWDLIRVIFWVFLLRGAALIYRPKLLMGL